MICSISGEIPIEPVVSKKSGLIYEKSLILKYIDETGKEPTTNEPLTESDIIIIKVDKLVKPRQVSNLSVPGLITSLQNEWDEAMSEIFSLHQALDNTRQELAQALYQHDAACRVIARIMKERDEARAQLAAIPTTSYAISNNVIQQPTSQVIESASTSESTDSPGLLPDYIITSVTNKCKELSTSRKEKKNQIVSIDKEWFNKYKTIKTFSPHKTNKPGVTCLSIYQDRFIASGGNDGVAIVLDKQSDKVIHKYTGHDKKLTDVLIDSKYSSSNVVYTASADKTIKIWKDGSLSSTLTTHTDEVTSIAQHPVSDYLVSTSLDSTWSLWDVNSTKLIKKISNSIDNTLVNTKNRIGRFHPDGLILSIGTDNSGILLWDIREQKIEAKLIDNNVDSYIVNGLSFNENGYLLANTTIDGSVNIWDLRKLKLIKTINVGSSAAVSFNPSGSHLAYAGTGDIQIAAVKEYSPLLSAGQLAHSKEVTSIQWSSDSSFFVTSSLDRTIKIHSIE
mmetsp:Transcript_7366/g.6601  ORF Transcript_7366/g.6601 Transcript_7366/m.6601 type:complete len:508 (+) Transcript_7366:21-1544(+)